LGLGVSLVAIRVVLERLAPVRLANLVGGRLTLDAQDFVVVALGGHRRERVSAQPRTSARGLYTSCGVRNLSLDTELSTLSTLDSRLLGRGSLQSLLRAQALGVLLGQRPAQRVEL